MPLYNVTSGEGDDKVERLVEASNKATALNYAARNHFKAEIAKPEDLIRLTKAGVELEVATGADAATTDDNGGTTVET